MRVLLLAQKTLYADIIVKQFLKIEGIEVVGLVFSKALLSGRSRIESIKILIKKCGMGLLWEKYLDCLFCPSAMKDDNLPIYYTENINSPDFTDTMRKLKPDLIFSIFFNQILKDDFLKIAPGRVINIHPAYLPSYRGVGPTFWALANNEQETGVSFHFITEGIDEGDIIDQEKIFINKEDTVHSLYLKCALKAAEMLPRLINNVKSGTITPLKQDETKASYYGLPDKAGYKKFRHYKRRFITLDNIFHLRNQLSKV